MEGSFQSVSNNATAQKWQADLEGEHGIDLRK
jgi:hypothetical protein